MRAQPATLRIDLDSMPLAAAEVAERGLRLAGGTPRREVHELARSILLPATHAAYLAALPAKQGREIGRRRRRIEEAWGQPRVVRAEGDEAIDAFISLHREQAGRKGGFMTPQMAGFFRGLHRDAGAVIDRLEAADGQPLALCLSFDDGATYSAYNCARVSTAD